MDETQKRQGSSGEQQPLPERRKWHAPQFFIAGLGSTFSVLNAGHDAAPKGNPMLS